MELGSYFLFLQEQIKDIIIIIGHEGYKYYVGDLLEGAAGGRRGRDERRRGCGQAQVETGAEPASARSPIVSKPLIPAAKNGVAERASRGRGTVCRGRNHFSTHMQRRVSHQESVDVCASSHWEDKSSGSSCMRGAPDSHARQVHERGGREGERQRARA